MLILDICQQVMTERILKNTCRSVPFLNLHFEVVV